MKYSPSGIQRFASLVLGKPLYPYQSQVAEAILSSILKGEGRIFTVMMARQSGKNQLSAVLEACLLLGMERGTIIKAAPTFVPQAQTSRQRLLSLLNVPALRERLWTSNGYIVGLAPSADPALRRAQAGPRVTFYSAGPESHVVGATADLLLEIDEAQDVASEKFERDFRPMASTCNATTVLYGTAWTDDTLLARQRAHNLEQERRTGIRTHFEYDWQALGAINPAYRAYVEQEIARLGSDHPAIQTQYRLQPLSGAGYLFTALQRTQLQGAHSWQEEPVAEDLKEGCYVAGMDVAGEERADPLQSKRVTRQRKRDSTVISIGRVTYNELGLPSVAIVHQEWWTGKPYLEQYAATIALVERWGLRTLVVDATGQGAGLASLLVSRLGEERVRPFVFTRASKSHLAYQLLTLLNSGRLKLYVAQGAPRQVYEECWLQLRQARYSLPGPEQLNIYVDPANGHDDFLMSLAILTEALESLLVPAVSALIPPPRYYSEDGHF